MLKSDGDKNGKKSRGLISKNNNFARAVHFFFFTFLCRCCCNMEFPSYTFYEENVVHQEP